MAWITGKVQQYSGCPKKKNIITVGESFNVKGMKMNLIDNLLAEKNHEQAQIGGRWVIARPYRNDSFLFRLKEAWKVLTGKAETLYYYKQ